eukprot:359869-Chlamydomonas_euryale.AAC.36
MPRGAFIDERSFAYCCSPAALPLHPGLVVRPAGTSASDWAERRGAVGRGASERSCHGCTVCLGIVAGALLDLCVTHEPHRMCRRERMRPPTTPCATYRVAWGDWRGMRRCCLCLSAYTFPKTFVDACMHPVHMTVMQQLVNASVKAQRPHQLRTPCLLHATR